MFSGAARIARWAAALFGLLWLVSMLGISSAFADPVPGLGTPGMYYEIPRRIEVLLVLLYSLGGLALVIVVLAVLAWVQRYWSLGGRIVYSLLAVLAALLTWALIYWNLLP
jgi:hypothetical protein